MSDMTVFRILKKTVFLHCKIPIITYNEANRISNRLPVNKTFQQKKGINSQHSPSGYSRNAPILVVKYL